ncbi:MAG: M48 family metalloprotease [Treponema sp.]|nr:M48 family metalloprotease [Treponema sp.]
MKKAVIIAVLLISACATGRGKRTIVEVENKGSGMGIPVPDWVKTYVEKGVSALQAQYQDSYCIVGEETGANRQFVLAWADQASAQQRIGSLLRSNIEGRFHAAISATGQSGAGGESSGRYQQEIDTILNTVVNVSYSGARREADWWSLRRRYDPDNKGVYADEYTAYVLYTVPKAEMNRQIAFALETGVSKDSVLYDITISLARDILLQGYDQTELAGTAAIEQTAAASYDPPDSPTTLALEEISFLDTYGIGRDIAAAILSSYKLWNADPRLTSYVNLICATIVINSPSPLLYNGYHVAILDTDEINAFATPGGHIFITRGLIAAADSEDALAAVIAHEIAHIQLNHGLRAIQSNRGVEDWFSQFTSSGAQEIIGAINSGFSQIQEFDADITALSLLAAAGYSPQGLPDMLRELQKIQSGTQGGFNQTHPSPESRLVNAQIAIARYPQAPDTRRFRQARFTALK